MKETKVIIRDLMLDRDIEGRFYEDEKLSNIIKWARGFIPNDNVILLDIYPEKD